MEFDWNSEYGEIISYLLDGLEDEHYGTSKIAWEEIKEKWNIKSEHGIKP